jgi:hypothetical protein
MITWRMPASPARVRHYTPAPRTKQAILWTFARVPLDGSTPSDLSSGRAEASEGDLPQIASCKLDEVQTHLIITDHLVQTGGIGYPAIWQPGILDCRIAGLPNCQEVLAPRRLMTPDRGASPGEGE